MGVSRVELLLTACGGCTISEAGTGILGIFAFSTRGGEGEGSRGTHSLDTSVFALANIDVDRLNDPAVLDLLARWIVPQKPHGDMPTLMVLWVIDHYFRSTDAANSRHGAAHLAIVNDRTVIGPGQVVSKWNAPWGLNDPLLRMTGVDVSDIETIEVLHIPRKKSPFEQYFKSHENFRQHVEQLRAAGTLTPDG